MRTLVIVGASTTRPGRRAGSTRRAASGQGAHERASASASSALLTMWPAGFTRPRDHDHRQAERARRLDLGDRSPLPPEFLRNDHLDLALLQQAQLGVAIERPALLQQDEIVAAARLAADR